MKLDHYYALQSKIDTGDLIEWRGTGPISRAIRLVTRKAVNHSSLVVRLPYEGCTRRFVIEALGSGLEFKLLSAQLENHSGSAWWYGLKPDYDCRRNEIGLWAFEQLACQNGYDYGSIVRQLFGRVSLDARRYFCSEFYDAALQSCRLANPDPAGARRPGDFSNLGIFLSRAQLI